jgi:hypothetical protein
VIERPGERRISQHQRVLFVLAGVVLSQRVATLHVRVVHAVEQHVHAADAEHGAVVLKAVKEAFVKVFV